MAEDEEKRGFKVQDRRRFSSEGDAKADAPEEKPAPKADVGDARGPTMGAQAEASAAYEKAASKRGGEATQFEDITFASFVVGLSTEALALLGEIPHPATGEQIQDVRGAQQLIDILALLQQKTRGNLDHDEQGLLDAILFDLRMKYVEKARQTSR